MFKIIQKWWAVLIGLIIVIIIGAVWFINRFQPIKKITPQSPEVSLSPTESATPSEVTTRLFRAKDVPQNTFFDFEATIPIHWEAEYIPSIESLNIYDPALPGDINLEKSVIFLRHFSGSTFLTLSTVTIHERAETKIANRPAVRYVIEKKSNSANFANQPAWRNVRHTVTDIRLSDSNPSLFYVIAERPGYTASYQEFLNTLKF